MDCIQVADVQHCAHFLVMTHLKCVHARGRQQGNCSTGLAMSNMCVQRHAQAAGLVIKEEPHTMRVPRSQRGGDVVEPLVREQWFVKAEPLAKPALQVHAHAAGRPQTLAAD